MVIDPIIKIEPLTEASTTKNQTELIIIITVCVIVGLLITISILAYVYKQRNVLKNTQEIEISTVAVQPKRTKFQSKNKMKSFK